MKRLVLVVALAGCTRAATSPAPPGASDAGSPATIPAVVVYGELVEAGCLEADDSGEGFASVVNLEFSDAEPPWLACLAGGGTVADCAAPCGTYFP